MRIDAGSPTDYPAFRSEMLTIPLPRSALEVHHVREARTTGGIDCSNVRPPLDRRATSRFRPNLEILDARVVPTANNWVGGVSSDASVAANWSLNHVPVAGEDVLFVPYVVPLSPPTSVDCINFSGPADGGKYNSVFFDAAYTAKVTLSQGFDTKALHLNNGTLDQPYLSQDETDITVTGGPTVDSYNQYYLNGAPDFKWTGGILNSTSHAANLILNGASGIVDPDGGELTTGNSIDLCSSGIADTILTFTTGAVAFSNTSTTITAEPIPANRQKKVEISTEGAFEFRANLKQINLNGGDWFKIAVGHLNAGVPIYNHGGNIIIHNGGSLQLDGMVNVNNQQIPADSYYQDGGQLGIQNGSTLTSVKAVVINGGYLRTFYNSGLADTIDAQTAIIDADLLIYAGDTEICYTDFTGQHYGTLNVKKTVDLEGGTYHPKIDGTTTGRCDILVSDGNFSVDQSPNNAGRAVLSPSNPAGANTIANGLWKIIKSKNGTFTGTFWLTNLQYFAGPPARSFTWGTLGNPANTAILTS